MALSWLDDSGYDDDGTKIRKEALGRKHKVFMWLGYGIATVYI